ncbi:MAG: hypothetical protein BWY75_03444 [bacterium ADurb.Bin425]|nr:MAG: hypothetical protein BWY75_03444 [bacterium ADurb.Bin425]
MYAPLDNAGKVLHRQAGSIKTIDLTVVSQQVIDTADIHIRSTTVTGEVDENKVVGVGNSGQPLITELGENIGSGSLLVGQ